MSEEGLKLIALETEGFKRIKAVAGRFKENGLTVIGGGNGEGKTSFIDSAIWALGGDKYKPSAFLHDGDEKVNIRLELSNGLIVERRGKNGALKVSGGDGKQTLLDSLIGELTLDLPKFMAASDREKAAMLLKAFPELAAALQKFDVKIRELYEVRTITGRDQLQKTKYAAELPHHEDAPDVPLSGKEMTDKLTNALGINARNAEIRRGASAALTEIDRKEKAFAVDQERYDDLVKRMKEARDIMETAAAAIVTAKSVYAEATLKTNGLVDADTSAIQQELERMDIINAHVRDNINKREAIDAAERLSQEFAKQTTEIEELRQKRADLLLTVQMPLEGLSIDEESRLVFNRRNWDCMATSEQYRVATALAASLKPSCKFVLLDRIEAMDKKTLAEFDAWLAERGLQGICTRVSDGDECHIIIEDGSVLRTNDPAPSKQVWAL